MKQKPAITRNMGPTWRYISIEDLNRIRTGDFAGFVSNNNGVDVRGGFDYSYMKAQGTRPATFRKTFPMYGKFDLLGQYDFDRHEWLNDVYYCGILDEPGTNVGRPVWYWFGYRIVIEFFDNNAVVDFTGPIDEDANLAYAFGKFLVVFGKKYEIKVVNDHLLNISERNGQEIN